MMLSAIDFRGPTASHDFTRSLSNTGFALLRNTNVSNNLIATVYDEWVTFFSTDIKHEYLISERQDGYIPASLSETAKNSNTKDLKEFFHLYFPWGRYPKEISYLSQALFLQLFGLANTLLGWIEKNTPQDIFAAQITDSVSLQRSLFRVIHYPPLADFKPGAVRAAEHEDINLITILPAASTPGLQVKDLNGDWSAVIVEEGDIIVNCGDMLQECSKHYYKSTTHRVVNPSSERENISRMSIPLFLHPKENFYLSSKYPTAGQYLNERLQELGLVS